MKKHAPAFLAIVNDAKSRIKETNIPTVHSRLDGKQTFRFIDVREDLEWQKGHLPFAEHIGKGVIERDIEKIIPEKDCEIILYCGGGFRSAMAADNLQKMGYTNVWSMDGGFRFWKEAGHEIITE